MNSYEFLEFYNKRGENLNLVRDESTGIWEGTIHVDSVSVGLFESETITIIEKFKTSGGMIEYGKPHYPNPTFLPTGGPQWVAYWEDDKNTAFTLYTFDMGQVGPDITIISDDDEYLITVDYDLNETEDSDGIKITDNITSEGAQLNVALYSELEDIYERTLIIAEADTNDTIAKLKFYGETIGEDERLTVNLRNLGRAIRNSDFKIFADTDINEDCVDYEFMNAKRKELLLEGHEVFDYIGSYRGIINAIKFFGYNNLQLREYWINIDEDSQNYGKYTSNTVIDIFDDTVDFNDQRINLPSKVLKKTSLFSLVYRINEVTDEEDEFDLPITEETSAYTFDEVIIKLFGLKKILRERFLWGNSRIVDIIGEADYFAKIDQVAWIDQQEIDKFETGIDPEFDIETDCLIIDLREVGDLFSPASTPLLLNPDWTLWNEPLTEISEVLAAYFKGYSPKLDTVAELEDKPGIPVGCPVKLTNKSFEITWDDADFTWDDMSASGDNIIDFEPENPGTGDIFRIKDETSGELISYTATSGDTVDDVVTGLYNAWLVAKAIDDGRPWSYYSVTREDTSGDGDYDTLRFRQIFAGALGIDFQTYVVDGGVPGNNPALTKQLPAVSTLFTWDTIGRKNFYEMEWIVSKEEDDLPAWTYTVRGDIGDFDEHSLVVPYIGTYTVELRLFDTFNQTSSLRKTDAFEVKPYNVDFLGFAKYLDREYTWDNLPDISWDEYAATWDNPVFYNNSWDELRLTFDDLNRANYALNNTDQNHQMNYYVQSGDDLNTEFFVGPYTWDNFPNDVTWDEMSHLTWDNMILTGDTPASFRLYAVKSGERLIVEQEFPNTDIGIHTFETDDLVLAAAELNASSDDVISKYIYNPVIGIDTSGTEEIVWIEAVAKFNGENGDFTAVYGDANVDIRLKQLSKTYNPTPQEILIIDSAKVLNRMTHVTFTYSPSKIPGKKLPTWKITNNSKPDEDDIYFDGQWLTYLFREKGEYTIELELTDTNGNKATGSRNLIIIK